MKVAEVGDRVIRTAGDGQGITGTVERLIEDDMLVVRCDSWHPKWVERHKPLFRHYSISNWALLSAAYGAPPFFPLEAANA